jgi:hypothetical protein
MVKIINYKRRILDQIIKYSKGYEVKFGDVTGATLRDFEDALRESRLDLDGDEVQQISREFLVAKYK